MSTSTSFSPDQLQPGRYRHYKGRDYQVFGVARHSETEEPVVVYRCLYGDGSLWVRPLAMFLEEVSLGGESVARFTYVGPMESSAGFGSD